MKSLKGGAFNRTTASTNMNDQVKESLIYKLVWSIVKFRHEVMKILIVVFLPNWFVLWTGKPMYRVSHIEVCFLIWL